MDTSKTYILQCRKASKMQKEWRGPNRRVGDFYWSKFTDDVEVAGDCPFHQTSGYIWLPRQDQLQEMVGGLERGFIDFPKWLAFTYGLNYGDKPNGHLHIFTTWEQLWLAFVMKEKFNKIWGGRDWLIAA